MHTETDKKSFHIVWKYKVPTENQSQFEKEYGIGGSWAKFFSESDYYKGSYLYHSVEKPDSYLLVDVWEDQASYEAFKGSHSERYHQLSNSFESLYSSEELLGGF